MDYAVFEARVMELLFKTDSKLTPQLAAFRVGCSVEVARRFLDQMVTTEILVLESDDDGVLYYDVQGRPPPTHEPLSWGARAATPVVVSTGEGGGVNIQIHNPPPQVVVLSGAEKSVGGAAALGLFFGPLGLLYSTGVGALVMFLLGFVLLGATGGAGLLLTAPLCAIWGAHAAAEHNERLLQRARQALLPAGPP